jgi:hypothetical protein
MMALYLYLLVALMVLALCWRTVAILSLVVVSANATPHTKIAKR